MTDRSINKGIASLEKLAERMDAAERILFFTGAGISTESGIPDFRSPGTGLWTKMKPIPFNEFMASDAVRQESWRRKFEGQRSIDQAVPNKGHLAIAQLVRQGKSLGVITQNVDNLHQQSGVPDNKVIELHGNASYATCLNCGERYELALLEQQLHKEGRVPACKHCGGVIKSATISFGQAMPEPAMSAAQSLTEVCDLMIVAGSSLLVYPAAGFPEYAVRLGAGLAIINREPTPLDDIADLVLHLEIGQTLAYLAGLN